jgi:hypothetical protein
MNFGGFNALSKIHVDTWFEHVRWMYRQMSEIETYVQFERNYTVITHLIIAYSQC